MIFRFGLDSNLKIKINQNECCKLVQILMLNHKMVVFLHVRSFGQQKKNSLKKVVLVFAVGIDKKNTTIRLKRWKKRIRKLQIDQMHMSDIG